VSRGQRRKRSSAPSPGHASRPPSQPSPGRASRQPSGASSGRASRPPSEPSPGRASRQPSGAASGRAGSDTGGFPDLGFVPPCGICGHCGRGDRVRHPLTHGLSVWLCQAHRSDGFMQRRGGREFAARLATAWMATGQLTVRKRDALAAHIRRVEAADKQRDRPGSYSWPVLRREAERRFATGEPPAEVILELRRTYRDGPAMVPSVRTMRRWYTQARWMASAPRDRRHGPRQPVPRVGAKSRWQPLIELILTGYAYPVAPAPHSRQRDP
jgi:hypothetical protein